MKDDLTEIQGIGPATADKILDVVETHEDTQDDELVSRAYQKLSEGKHRLALDALEQALDKD